MNKKYAQLYRRRRWFTNETRDNLLSTFGPWVALYLLMLFAGLVATFVVWWRTK